MPKAKVNVRNLINAIILIVAVLTIGHLIFENLRTFGYIMIVALGFGGVIMIHEFGHFIVAKAGGIKVEAFSIGFPPTLMGIQKTERGIRFRLLPNFIKSGSEEESEGGIVFTLNTNCKPSDTEYRIGLLPFGGFVAMLGQSDSGTVEETNDPRSFTNKPIWIRISVVAAGVIFNAISAVIIFMAVFLVGLSLPPAEVGSVLPGSPADVAGLRAGDRIVEVNGERFVDFTSLPMAAALSDKDEKVSLMILRPNETGGFNEPFEVGVAAKLPAKAIVPIRAFGLSQANTLKIADMGSEENDEMLFSSTGLRGNDVVVAVNGKPVQKAWQLEEIVGDASRQAATLTVQRIDSESQEEITTDVDIPLFLKPETYNFETGHDLAHIFSMVPRLKIDGVIDRTKPGNWRESVKLWWRQNILKQEVLPPLLKVDDIIVKIADVEYPTYTELREVTAEHKDMPMQMVVLRKDENGIESPTEVTVTPRQQFTRNGGGPVTIGIYPVLDASEPIVAKTVAVEGGPNKLNIPSGATITAVDDEKVSSFFDIIRIIRKNVGQRISVDYRLDDEQAGGALLIIGEDNDYITARTNFDAMVPFEALRENYKASGPIEAVGMGLKKTKMFIVQTVMTLKGLFSKSVSPSTLSGPLGIVTTSYTIARSSMSYYIYFMGLLSSCIAVMNLLPLPVVDGGVIVLLIVEKIKGAPLSQKAQGIISYVGLAFILSLFAWLIYNDALNFVLSQ